MPSCSGREAMRQTTRASGLRPSAAAHPYSERIRLLPRAFGPSAAWHYTTGMKVERAARWLGVYALAAGLACSHRALDADGKTQENPAASSMKGAGCAADTDCGAGGRCVPVTADRDLLMVAPCFIGTQCTTDAACGAGSVCDLFPLPDVSFCPNIELTCGQACSDDPSTGRLCGEFNSCTEGHCVRQRCDDPDFVGCPSSMQCDPTYVWDADPSVPIGKYYLYGTSGVSSSVAQERLAAETGCVFRTCDDADGYQCLSGLRCDPAQAKPENSGCVAIPCAELGRCSNDDYYLCEPTSSAPHEKALDAHGCTYRNCEERSCGTGYSCDFDSPKSDSSGCRITLCNEPAGRTCEANTKCAPEDPAAFASGCAPMQCDTDGFECSKSNMVCAPDAPNRNQFGCVAAPILLPAVSATTSSLVPSTSAPSATPAPQGTTVSTSASQIAAASSSAPPATTTASAAVSASGSPGPFVGFCQ